MADEKPTDNVHVVGTTEDGLILKDKDGNISRTMPMKAGVPLGPEDDVVQLSRTDDPKVLSVKTLYSSEHKGPPRAATPAYRKGWGTVFGKKPKKEDMN